MTVQDDYPAITILADACADKADDGVPEAVRAWREVARLRQWKDEAMAEGKEWMGGHNPGRHFYPPGCGERCQKFL